MLQNGSFTSISLKSITIVCIADDCKYFIVFSIGGVFLSTRYTILIFVLFGVVFTQMVFSIKLSENVNIFFIVFLRKSPAVAAQANIFVDC